MASSDSDSDVDFESADEGEHSNAITNVTNQSKSDHRTTINDDLKNKQESRANEGSKEKSNEVESKTFHIGESSNNPSESNNRLSGETNVGLPKNRLCEERVKTETASSETDILPAIEKELRSDDLSTEFEASNQSEEDKSLKTENVVSDVCSLLGKETISEKPAEVIADASKSRLPEQKESGSKADGKKPELASWTPDIKETISENLKEKPAEDIASATKSLKKEEKVSGSETKVSDSEADKKAELASWTPEIKDKDAVKRTVSDSEAGTGNRILLFKERKALEKTTKASSLNEKDVLDKLSECATKDEKKISPGWGLGNWSSSFISTAASSVSTFTSQVSQGIGTVFETVEASLGVPAPEDLAANKNLPTISDGKNNVNHETSGNLGKQDSGERTTPIDQDTQKGPVGSLLGGVSAFTKAFESTSSKMITGSLDTLELIGRKTMDILTEGDPGLRKKRSIFTGGGSTLSQVLKEARSKAEEESDDVNEKLVHYSKLFDEYQGLVHLEALEMLSDRCKSHVQKRSMESEDETLTTELEHLREICEDLPAPDDTPDDEITQDFESHLNEHCRALPFKTKVEKIKSVQCSATAWLINCKEDQDKGEVKDPIDVYKKAISSLAELTAAIMEHYHKIAEMALVTSIPGVSVEECAKNLTGLTTVFCTEVVIISSSFCQCLSTAADDSEDPDAVNPLITNVYLECSNSNAYIQDAFQLLIPVLQDLAIRHRDDV